MVARNAKNTGIRMFTAEYDALNAACTALAGEDWEVTPSLLLDIAGMEEAHRLGFSPPAAEGRRSARPGSG